MCVYMQPHILLVCMQNARTHTLTHINTHTHRLIIASDGASRKKASLKKLQTVLGPEFTKLSGGAKVRIHYYNILPPYACTHSYTHLYTQVYKCTGQQIQLYYPSS